MWMCCLAVRPDGWLCASSCFSDTQMCQNEQLQAEVAALSAKLDEAMRL
jgi:hypothetical protein